MATTAVECVSYPAVVMCEPGLPSQLGSQLWPRILRPVQLDRLCKHGSDSQSSERNPILRDRHPSYLCSVGRDFLLESCQG
jgi:hypothetical protein